MRKTKSLLSVLAASLSLGFGGAAHAGLFTSTITSGLNLYEDQSREGYVDVNQDGLFNTGDVLVGFARIDNRTTPPPGPLNNTTYAVFSQQVVGISGSVVQFGATTAAGLTLSALTGGTAGANDMFAIYSSAAGAYGVDLITTSPGNVGTGGAITLKDYINYIITNGTVDMIMGAVDSPLCTGGTSDCFQAQVNVASFAGGPNAQFIGLAPTVGVASFIAGLEVTLDPAGWTIPDNTQAGAFFSGPLTTTAEFGINRGTAAGYVGQVNAAEWINTSEMSALAQCSPDPTNLGAGAVACGFTNNVAFGFNAVAVPEPGTLSLLGLSLLGMAAVRRRRS